MEVVLRATQMFDLHCNNFSSTVTKYVNSKNKYNVHIPSLYPTWQTLREGLHSQTDKCLAPMEEIH